MKMPSAFILSIRCLETFFEQFFHSAKSTAWLIWASFCSRCQQLYALSPSSLKSFIRSPASSLVYFLCDSHATPWPIELYFLALQQYVVYGYLRVVALLLVSRILTLFTLFTFFDVSYVAANVLRQITIYIDRTDFADLPCVCFLAAPVIVLRPSSHNTWFVLKPHRHPKHALFFSAFPPLATWTITR